MDSGRLSLESIKDVLIKLQDQAPLKMFVGIILTMLSWVFKGDVEIVIVIYTLIFFDTFTGVWIALNNHSVSSRGFFRSPVKCMVYFMMIIISRLVDKTLPITIASPVMDAFLVTTEAVSILENLSKLGFPVPTFLIKRLKTFYEK